MKKILNNKYTRNQLYNALMQSSKQRHKNPFSIKVDGKQYIIKLSVD